MFRDTIYLLSNLNPRDCVHIGHLFAAPWTLNIMLCLVLGVEEHPGNARYCYFLMQFMTTLEADDRIVKALVGAAKAHKVYVLM